MRTAELPGFTGGQNMLRYAHIGKIDNHSIGNTTDGIIGAFVWVLPLVDGQVASFDGKWADIKQADPTASFPLRHAQT